MVRPFHALVALLACTSVLPTTGAQEPAKPAQPKDFWWNDAPPVREVPLPIVPDHWLVLPNDGSPSAAQVFARHLFESNAPAPSTESGDGLPWKALDSTHPSAVVAAYTHFSSERDQIRMARLTGAEFLFVNGEGFVGDVARRGFRGVPIALRKGNNELYVLGVAGSFELELWCPQTRAVLGSWDVAWPDESLDGDEMRYPVFNASNDPASCLHVHYANAYRVGADHKLGTGEWNDGGDILPLGVRVAWNYFGFLALDEWSPRSEEEASVVPLCVYVAGDKSPDEQLLQCAPFSERRKTRPSGLPPRDTFAILGTPLSALGTNTMLVFPDYETSSCARFDQQLCWYRAWFTPNAISAQDLISLDPKRDPQAERAADAAWALQNFVVYGNAETNGAWSRFVPDDSPIQAYEGRLSVNGRDFDRDDICGWFRFTAKSGKHVVVIVSTGARGTRLVYMAQPLFAQAAGLDYCFWDSHGKGGTPGEFTSGKFASKR